jgi:hypothetical protein
VTAAGQAAVTNELSKDGPVSMLPGGLSGTDRMADEDCV